MEKQLNINFDAMNLKTLTLSLLATAAMFGAQAQDTSSDAEKVAAKEARISAMTRTVAEELQLDAEQTQRMAESDDRYAIGMSAMRSLTNDHDLLVKKSDELYQQHERELKEILGEEKYQHLHDWRKAKSNEGMNKLQQVDPKPQPVTPMATE